MSRAGAVVGAPDPIWVEHWADELGLTPAGDLTVQRIGQGHSNLTFGLSDSSGPRWVLRRPPPGELLASAHDVVREARVLHALDATDVPVPRVIGVRHDAGGTPWVMMTFVHGRVLDDVAAASAVPTTERHALGLSMARTLAEVHAVDVDRAGLGDLASRAPYAPRQLRRWTRQWEATRSRDLPGMDELTARLVAAVPEQTEVCLVHGDFHVKNVISDDGQVVAVLDWELSTLGDPVADLGTLLAYWPHRGELASADQQSPSTLEGFCSRDDLVAAYAAASGRDVSTVGFWHALGLWKIAVIAEGVRRRVELHPSASLASPPTAEDVAALVHRARQVADDAGL